MDISLIKQYAILHELNKDYGNGVTYNRMIYHLFRDHGCKNALDYGCGKGALADALRKNGIPTDKYDPAILEYSNTPIGKYDMVIANDVLEHLTIEDHEEEIDKIKSLSSIILFFNISCRKAVHHLPDGRNCHTLVRSPKWWIEKFQSCNDFEIIINDYRESNKNLLLALKRIT